MRGSYLAVFALSALIPLGLVSAVNFSVDVKGVYAGDSSSRRATEYVDALLDSPAGLVQSPYERRIKLELARRAPAECFVTGSSHEMQIGRDVFAPAQARCRSLVNLAVSGGGVEDLLTQLGALSGRQDLRALYVGIAPWHLRWGADIRWTELANDYQQGRLRLGLPVAAVESGLTERLTNLVNGRYFLRNAVALWEGDWREAAALPRRVAVDGSNVAIDEAITAPDGSHRYSRRYLASMPLAAAAVGDGTYKIAQTYVDPRVIAELSAAFAAFRAGGIHIAFVLTPYHPQVMRCMPERVCEAMAAVDRAIRGLAADLGAEVIGGYDPRPFGLVAADFYDEMHLARGAYPRLR